MDYTHKLRCINIKYLNTGYNMDQWQHLAFSLYFSLPLRKQKGNTANKAAKKTEQE